MLDSQLDRQLSELAERGTSTGFTARVLARLDQPAPAARLQPMRALLLVSPALVLALALGGGWRWHELRQRAAADRQIAALRAERDRLEAEVAALRRQVARPARLMRVGGDERVDYVIDLTSTAPGGGQPPPTTRATPWTGGSR